MVVRIEVATKEHIPLLIGGMSPVIRDEIRKLYPELEITEVIEKSFAMSKEAYVAFVDDDIVCAMGVATSSLLSDKGMPWLIPHKNVNKHKWIFLGGCRNWIKHLSSQYRVLENMVTAKNPRAIKWLKWVGFEVGKPVMLNGSLFYPYKLERKD